MDMYWILIGGTMLLSIIVQLNLKAKEKRYSKIPTPFGLTGADIARRMLLENGIKDVKVLATSGILTDHYNPQNKTVNLSENVYNSSNIMAAAVAAHECGHALQHAYGYAPLKMRSALVPVVNFASQFVMWILLAGIIMIIAYFNYKHK